MNPGIAAVAFWAGLLAILYLALALPVVRGRLRGRVPLGHGDDPTLHRMIRVHGNFAEYVPFALVLMTLAALMGWGSLYLHIIGGTLFVARVLHAIGLILRQGPSAGRFFGTLFTWIVLAVLAAMCLARGLGPW